jgi:hypothetical protein
LVLLLVAATAVLPARADDTTNLSSFDLRTSGAALRWTVDLKASPIPAEHTVDLSIPHTRAELAAGPSGHALASTAWPGDTLAKACSAAPQVPCYGVVAEAFSPQGPEDSSNDQIASAEMKAHTKGLVTNAIARFTPQGVPGISFGPMASTSHSEAKTAQAITESTSELSAVDLGGGVVHIDSIRSIAKVVTDGTKAEATGGTTLTGATVAGVPVFIDQNGVHVATMDAGGNPVNQLLDAGVRAALQQAGIGMEVPGPVKKVAEAQGDIVASGLIVTLDDGPLVKLIPPGTGLPADPTGRTTLVLGQAAATASAAGAFADLGATIADAGAAASGGAGAGGGVLGATVGSAAISPADTSLSSSGASSPSSPAPASLGGASPVASVTGTPVSLALAVGIVLLALLGAVGLRRFAAAVLEPSTVTACPLETKRE